MQQDTVIEVSASSDQSFADALRQGVEEATRAVQQMSTREVAGPLSDTGSAKVRYKVLMHIDFEIEEAPEAGEAQLQERTASQGLPLSGGQINPGDDVPLGTPGTGENICPTCGGSGEVKGRSCQNCGGTGYVVEAIGGA